MEPSLRTLYPDKALIEGDDPFFTIGAVDETTNCLVVNTGGVTRTIHVSVLNAMSRWRLRTVRLKQGAGR